jgi:hypothetical protein
MVTKATITNLRHLLERGEAFSSGVGTQTTAEGDHGCYGKTPTATLALA